MVFLFKENFQRFLWLDLKVCSDQFFLFDKSSNPIFVKSLPPISSALAGSFFSRRYNLFKRSLAPSAGGQAKTGAVSIAVDTTGPKRFINNPLTKLHQMVSFPHKPSPTQSPVWQCQESLHLLNPSAPLGGHLHQWIRVWRTTMSDKLDHTLDIAWLDQFRSHQTGEYTPTPFKSGPWQGAQH